MLPRRRRLLGLAAAALLLPSCGTIANFYHKSTPDTPVGREVFGGVQRDLEFAESIPGGIVGMVVACLVVADLPLSAVGDVVTLPWTIRAERIRKCGPE
jgi:hypothetical protein